MQNERIDYTLRMSVTEKPEQNKERMKEKGGLEDKGREREREIKLQKFIQATRVHNNT